MPPPPLPRHPLSPHTLHLVVCNSIFSFVFLPLPVRPARLELFRSRGNRRGTGLIIFVIIISTTTIICLISSCMQDENEMAYKTPWEIHFLSIRFFGQEMKTARLNPVLVKSAACFRRLYAASKEKQNKRRTRTKSTQKDHAQNLYNLTNVSVSYTLKVKSHQA